MVLLHLILVFHLNIKIKIYCFEKHNSMAYGQHIIIVIHPRSQVHLLRTFAEYPFFPPRVLQISKAGKKSKNGFMSFNILLVKIQIIRKQKLIPRTSLVIFLVDTPSWKMDSFMSSRHMWEMLGDICVWLPTLLEQTAGE